MATKKKKKKSKEPDLFSSAPARRRKPKEWRYPRGVQYADVKIGDIFIINKSRNWTKDGEIEKLKGEVLEKGVYDTNSRYFVVRIIHPEWEDIEIEDIRRFILRKK